MSDALIGTNPLENSSHPLHPSVEFDWETVFDGDPEFRDRVIEIVSAFVAKLAEYFVRGGKSKVQGAGIRAYIFAWGVHPNVSRLTQTQLGELLGLNSKQSIGREVTRFRDAFGWCCPHMQTEDGRRKCKTREQRKKRERTIRGSDHSLEPIGQADQCASRECSAEGESGGGDSS